MKALVYGKEQEIPEATFQDWISPRDTVVVSIDMHEGHLSEDPACPCPAPRGRAKIAPIDAFHRQVRALGIPIIHVRSTLRPTGEDDLAGAHPAAWRSLAGLHGPTPSGIAEHALEGSRWTEMCTEVAEGDLMVTSKRRLSAFYPTDLDFLLRSMGARRVVLNGIMTDCCVLNAAFDGSNLGYRMTVPPDLTAGSNSEMEETALKMVSLHIGLVAHSSELLRLWSDAQRTRAA